MIRTEEILQRVEEVPPLPGSVVQLISVLNDAESSVQDIVQVIRYDQALTAQMLRICNSAYFGISRSVSTLDDALRFLGTNKVFQLVMMLNTMSLLNHAQRGYRMHAGALWRHSVAAAIASTLFARRIHFEPDGLAFTGGLLHDIGKLVLDDYVGEAFQAIVTRVADEKVSFDEAEREILGVSHAEIGARLADRWHLPEPICRSVLHHHTPDDVDPPDPLVDLVYLGNVVCLLMGVSLGEDALYHRSKPEVMERHGLHQRDVELVGVTMMQELKQIEEAYGRAIQTAPHAAVVIGGPI